MLMLPGRVNRNEHSYRVSVCAFPFSRTTVVFFVHGDRKGSRVQVDITARCCVDIHRTSFAITWSYCKFFLNMLEEARLQDDNKGRKMACASHAPKSSVILFPQFGLTGELSDKIVL